MALMHGTSSECALQMYEDSLKYLFLVIKSKSGHDFVMDR